MDEFSWTLNSDGTIRHNKHELFNFRTSNSSSATVAQSPQEGDIIGISFDHIQLKFYINGVEVDHSLSNIKGTVYPALYGKFSNLYKMFISKFFL